MHSFRLAGFRHQLTNSRSDLLAALMAEFDGRQHLGLGGQRGSSFDHDDAVIGSGHDDVELGFAQLGVGGVGDQPPVDRSDGHRREGVLEGDVGKGQGGAGAGNGQRGRIHFGIRGQHHADDLRLAGIALRKQRAEGPVDHAAGKDLPLGGAPFALDEAARKASGGVGGLTVVDGERKKRDTGFWPRGTTRGHQNDGVAHTDDHSPVGLSSNFACFQAEGSTSKVDFYSMFHGNVLQALGD